MKAKYGINPISGCEKMNCANDPVTVLPESALPSVTIKCGGAVTCAVAHSEEVYNKYVDTAGNLRWTGTHSGEHIVRAEGDE